MQLICFGIDFYIRREKKGPVYVGQKLLTHFKNKWKLRVLPIHVVLHSVVDLLDSLALNIHRSFVLFLDHHH